MGCNCGNKGGKSTYLYTAPNGAQKTYNTEVEARAAVIRQGGGKVSVIPPR